MRRHGVRAQAIGALDGGSIELRYHSARALLALMDGHLTAAQRHVDAFVELRQVAVSTGPVEQRFPTIAARLALIGRDLESARAWVDRARVMDQPDVVRAVNVAGLESWLDTRTGRLSSALERLSRVLEVIDQRSMRPHHGAFDAIVSSAWARFCQAGRRNVSREGRSNRRPDSRWLQLDDLVRPRCSQHPVDSAVRRW